MTAKASSTQVLPPSATHVCGIYSLLQIFASDSKVSDGSGPFTQTQAVTVSLDQFDLCDFSELFATFTPADLPPGAFRIQPSLSSARLVASVPLVDTITGRTFNSSLDLTWDASRDGESFGRREQTNAPGVLTLDHSSIVTSLNAVVAGSVTTPNGTHTELNGEMANERVGSFVVLRGGGRPAPTSPREPTTTETKKSSFVQGQFGSQQGCISDGVFVNAQTRPPDAPANDDTTQLLTLNIARVDICTHELLLSAFTQVALPDGALIVSGNSSSGVLATTVDVLDSVSGTLVPITLDLLWAAVDPSTHDSIRDRLDLGGVTVITTSKGTFFNAVVSGSVTTPLGQFGPEPPLIAQIGSQTSGSVTLIR